MNQDILFFFQRREEALLLYGALEEQILHRVPQAEVRVKKTQISFFNKRGFAFVSFLPVRKGKARPKTYITVSFGLNHMVDSPRIDGAVEPYPNRWTHHVMVTSLDEIDEELMGWIVAAAEFSANKG